MRPSWRTGDAAVPQPVRIFGAAIGFDQTGVPLMSKREQSGVAEVDVARARRR